MNSRLTIFPKITNRKTENFGDKNFEVQNLTRMDFEAPKILNVMPNDAP